MLKRQKMRAAFGLVAVLFALGVLALAHVAGWQVLRLYLPPISRLSSYSVSISWLQRSLASWLQDPRRAEMSTRRSR